MERLPDDGITPLRIWRVTDGRAGHENMTNALAEALARHRTVEVVDVEAMPAVAAVARCLRPRRGAATGGQRWTRLVIGAGRRSHLTLLATAAEQDAASIVLLRPSLPWAHFDACIVPDHDPAPARSNVLTTRGVLNRMRPGTQRDGPGMFLVGGPSSHHRWMDAEVLAQIESVAGRDPAADWRIATSRRTPPSFIERLRRSHPVNASLVTPESVHRDWLPRSVAAAPTVWVTEDSVSMVYEALTAGSATGVLAVPRRGRSRVLDGLCALVLAGAVTRFAPCGPDPAPPETPLDEAQRAARWLLERCPRR